MKLTQDQKDAFRRACGRLESDAEDDLIAFYLANPRVLKAVASGQLRQMFGRETFPIEAPPDAVRNRMEEAVPRALVDAGKVQTLLVELPVTVDYRPTEDEALAKTGVDRAEMDPLFPPRTTVPEFEDWSVGYQVKKRQGGLIERRLRVLNVTTETTLRQVNNLIDLYGFIRTEPRTLLAFIDSYPEIYDDFPALVATRPMIPEKGRGDSLAPCLYFVEDVPSVSGRRPNRFAYEAIGENEIHRFAKYGLLVEEPARP